MLTECELHGSQDVPWVFYTKPTVAFLTSYPGHHFNNCFKEAAGEMGNRAPRPKARERHQPHWPILASAFSAISHLQLYGWADMGQKWRISTERASLNPLHCTIGWEKVEIHGCLQWDAVGYQFKGKLLSCPIFMWLSQMWEASPTLKQFRNDKCMKLKGANRRFQTRSSP